MRYKQLIGFWMYMVNNRPNICFVVNTLSQYMVEPRSVHWIGLKHVLRYISGSVDFKLDYVRGDGVSLRESTSRCCFGLGLGDVS